MDTYKILYLKKGEIVSTSAKNEKELLKHFLDLWKEGKAYLPFLEDFLARHWSSSLQRIYQTYFDALMIPNPSAVPTGILTRPPTKVKEPESEDEEDYGLDADNWSLDEGDDPASPIETTKQDSSRNSSNQPIIQQVSTPSTVSSMEVIEQISLTWIAMYLPTKVVDLIIKEIIAATEQATPRTDFFDKLKSEPHCIYCLKPNAIV